MTLEDIALIFTPGLGVKGIAHLIDSFGSAKAIFSASREELIMGAQLRPDIAESILSKAGFAMAQREMRYCERHGITPVAVTDDEYPPLLREVPDRPHVLFVMGNVQALAMRSVSIVGTRRVSSYGQIRCADFVKSLGSILPSIAVVSGLAFGVDSEAHRSALHHKLPTIAVVANPLPEVTPTQHTSLARDIIAEGGAIVSECHSQTKQRGTLYISRNRIIAGMSAATLIVESPISGGSIATAKIASDYNRLLMAIPGRLTDNNSAGCNFLIANRQALLCYSAEQMARELMWDSDSPADRPLVVNNEPALTREQQGLMGCFRLDEPLSIEELATLTSLDVGTLSAMLLELELLGVVRTLSGNRYMRLVSCSTI